MISTALAVWSGLALFHGFTVAVAAVRARRPLAMPAATLPACSIILPVKGVSQFLAANVGALAGLPGFGGEILLAVATDDDPCLAILAPIVARAPDRCSLLIGEATEFANPKLRNLAKAYRAARHDLVLFLDDSVCLDAPMLAALAGGLGPGVAAVTAAPHGTDAETLAAQAEAATCNGFLFRIEMFLALFGAAAAFGNALALRRSDLDGVGGLARLDEGPCEDNALSKALRESGGRIAILRRPVIRRIGRRPWRALGERLLRWKNCAKCHDPILFLLEPLIGGLAFNILGAVAIGAALACPWWQALALSLLAWYGAEAVLHLACRWPLRSTTVAGWVLRDLANPVATLAAIAVRRVRWRGTVIEMRPRWRRSRRAAPAPDRD